MSTFFQEIEDMKKHDHPTCTLKTCNIPGMTMATHCPARTGDGGLWDECCKHCDALIGRRYGGMARNYSKALSL